jgi:O-antigen ligase
VRQLNVEPPVEGTKEERVDSFCQHAILASILFILVWAPLAFGSTGPAAFLVIQAVTILAIVLWAVRWWFQRPFRLFWHPVCWAVLAFLLYAVPRCQLVEIQYVGREQLTHIVVYVALFFVILNNLNSKESANIVSMTLITVGFVVAFIGVVQFFKHNPTIWGEPRPQLYLARGSGTFLNPNNFAGYLEMIVPLALAYTIASRFSPTIKVLLAYSVLAMLAGIVVSLSRGGILAIAVTLTMFCLVLLAQRDYWLPALATLLSLAVVGIVLNDQFGSLQGRFAAAFQNEKLDSNNRFYYWQAAEQLYARNPVWGIGPGHFDVEFSQLRAPHVQGRPEYVHNDYLNTLCEWGTLGLAIVATACGLLVWGVFRAWRGVHRASNDFGAKKSDKTAFLLGASAGLVAAMVHAFVDFNMQIPADAITAVTLMALIAAQARFATEGYWKNPGYTGRIFLTALAGAAICYLAVVELHHARETFWLRRATGARVSADESLLCLKNAHEIEPANEKTDFMLGESLRLASKSGRPGYEAQSKEAIQLFTSGMELDRYNALFPLRIGMCLDWIDRSREATPYFELAERLDTNNAYIALEEARHYVALDDIPTANLWIAQSLALKATPEAWATLLLIQKNGSDPMYAPRK